MTEVYTLWARAREAAVFLLRLRNAERRQLGVGQVVGGRQLVAGEYWCGHPRVVAIARFNVQFTLPEVRYIGQRIYERHEKFFIPVDRCAATAEDALRIGRPFVEGVFRDYYERAQGEGKSRIERHQEGIARAQEKTTRAGERVVAVQFLALSAFEPGHEEE